MKGFLFLILSFSLTGLTASAQNPVSWTFSSKKLSHQQYEISITASIPKSWHVYSHKQPPEAIAVPTAIRFQANPLVQLKGAIKESGTLQKVKEEALGIEAWQYSNKLTYVQIVEVKTPSVKTNVGGSVVFQACTDEKCLPPATVTFQILLE
ncbi:MAG: hypothetical protein WCF67_00045 [Chitinophagaceae bacterium]